MYLKYGFFFELHETSTQITTHKNVFTQFRKG